MKKLIIVAAICGYSTTPGWAAESSPCDLRTLTVSSMYHLEMSDLLKVGEFQKLEASMEKNYQEFRKQGNGDHLFDTAPFLNMIHEPNSQLLAQWKKEMPQAFFANYVNGQNWQRQADNVRRGRPMSQLNDNDLDAIQDLQQKAREAFALAKAAKPDRAIVDAALILTDATERGPEATMEHLKRGIKVEPRNISARLAAINYLDPRWGGSFEAMEEVVKQATTAKLPAHHLAYLTMVVENSKGSHFEVIEQNKAKAREHYKKAYNICNQSNFAKDGLARTIGQ
jgi:hypothetical protein